MSDIRKSFMTTAMLSLFLGAIGVDRFYLGKVGTGILKLLTFGGVGIWYFIDLILILTGSMKDSKGHELEGRDRNIKTALIIVGVVLLLGIILGSVNSNNMSNMGSGVDNQDRIAPVEENKPIDAESEKEEIVTEATSSPTKQEAAPRSSAGGYESIYNTYAARLRAECPSLSMMECAEVSNEGITKMAEYMYSASGVNGQYATYSGWAGKLQDVYMAEAR